jgi:hypothetical protein
MKVGLKRALSKTLVRAVGGEDRLSAPAAELLLHVQPPLDHRRNELVLRSEDLSSPQRHTFRVPPNPKAGFDGIVVRCQVLECEPPSRLAYSWSAGPIIDTQVIYRLEPDGDGTRAFFEHSGFDMSQPWGEQLSAEPSLVG